MHLWMEKWGSAAGALLCALVIIFAALYTRQDELRRAPTKNAAADQSQTLQNTPSPHFARPADAPLISAFQGAYRQNGIWQMRPSVHYKTSIGQEIRAIAGGTVTHAADNLIEIIHADDLIACYQGEFSLLVHVDESLSAGQRIARMAKGNLCFSLQQAGRYMDPEAFFLRHISE